MSKPKYTIGFATFNDFDGAWFTIQALRLYHSECMADTEILVVDNNPILNQDGQRIVNPHTIALMQMFPQPDPRQGGAMVGGYVRGDVHSARYIPLEQPKGTSAPRQKVFDEAAGDYVICIDGHILLPPGSLAAIRKYYDEHPDTKNMLTGPLLMDGLKVYNTHFSPVWRSEMWGIWGTAEICRCGFYLDCIQVPPKAPPTEATVGQTSMGVCGFGSLTYPQVMYDRCPECGFEFPQNIEWNGHERVLEALGFRRNLERPDYDRPIEIPGNGLGFFSCRKEVWKEIGGFNKKFSGFGGEELYIHEKIRRNGGKNLCIPNAPWLHRFGRPGGVPYPLTRWQKVRNYVIGHGELGLDLQPIYDHFVATRLMPENEWKELADNPLDPPEWPKSVAVSPSAGTAASGGGCSGCPNTAWRNWDLEQFWQVALRTPSDLNEHTQVLRDMAANCKHVTEFGKRHSVSTVALLAGQPETFISYSNIFEPTIERLQEIPGRTHVEFRRGESLTADIDETDMLFIQTVHTEAHTLAELKRHHSKVRRWIVLLGTVVFGERGEGGQPGMLAGVRKFVREYPQWSVIRHYHNNNGLLILSRDEEDKKPLPGWGRMVWNYGVAKATHLAGGSKICSPEEIEARLQICDLCPSRSNDRCTECGCYLADSVDQRTMKVVEGKSAWRDQDCPLGKWPKLD
jgi:hypothetical protein